MIHKLNNKQIYKILINNTSVTIQSYTEVNTVYKCTHYDTIVCLRKRISTLHNIYIASHSQTSIMEIKFQYKKWTPEGYITTIGKDEIVIFL